MTDIAHVFVIVIAASPEQVWNGLTNPEFTRQCWHQTRVRSDFTAGTAIEFVQDDERVGCEGQILESRRPYELSYTWHFPLNPETRDESPSRVSFLLEAIPAGTKLTITHDRFADGSKVEPMVGAGWPFVLGGLKTLLETGTAVDFSAES